MASAKAKTTRRDPTPRFLGTMPFFNLENDNPERVYKWANAGQSYMPGGPDHYRLRGFTVETIQPGGVRPIGVTTLKEGEEIRLGDLILMSCARERYEADEDAAQEAADRREALIIKRRGIPDALRGIRSPYYKVSGEISPLTNDLRGVSDG